MLRRLSALTIPSRSAQPRLLEPRDSYLSAVDHMPSAQSSYTESWVVSRWRRNLTHTICEGEFPTDILHAVPRVEIQDVREYNASATLNLERIVRVLAVAEKYSVTAFIVVYLVPGDCRFRRLLGR